MSKLTLLAKLLRVKQYVKNLFIFLPLYFGQRLGDLDALANTLLAFFLFNAIASTVYIVNDIIDKENDQAHPEKKKRPIANGSISTGAALAIAILLSLSSFTLTVLLLPREMMTIYALYLGLNIFYCIRLKQIAIIDIFLIATGFVIRLMIGSAASATPLSHWIIIMVFMLALFLALAKRRDDVRLFLEDGKKRRKSVDGYNLHLVRSLMAMVASIIIVAYIFYTLSPSVMSKPDGDKLYLTSIFVILGLFRYMQQTIVFDKSASPTKLLYSDRVIQVSIALWVLAYAYVLYFPKLV